MGRLREVCGALSGIFMAAGILYGYDDLTDKSLKTDHYERIQELAARFRKENGSILCREILGLEEEHSRPIPPPKEEESLIASSFSSPVTSQKAQKAA